MVLWCLLVRTCCGVMQGVIVGVLVIERPHILVVNGW